MMPDTRTGISARRHITDRPLGARYPSEALVFGNFHDLRHEGGSRLLKAGWPLHHVQEMLGHASIGQTSTYLNVAKGGLHESMRKTDEARAGCNLLQATATATSTAHAAERKTTLRHDELAVAALHAPVAQWIEHRPSKPFSLMPRRSVLRIRLAFFVAGSRLVPPSTPCCGTRCNLLQGEPWPNRSSNRRPAANVARVAGSLREVLDRVAQSG